MHVMEGAWKSPKYGNLIYEQHLSQVRYTFDEYANTSVQPKYQIFARPKNRDKITCHNFDNTPIRWLECTNEWK